MEELTTGGIKNFYPAGRRLQRSLGAGTLGLVKDDPYPVDMPLHHQLHKGPGNFILYIESDSIFVFISHSDDHKRAGENSRVLNISSHTRTEPWFGLNGDCEGIKYQV